MNGASREQQRQLPSRSRLLEAALEEVAGRGMRGATIRRIAERAGVNEVTIFRHFGSKSALVAEALRKAVGGFEATAANPSGDLEGDVEKLALAFLGPLMARGLLVDSELEQAMLPACQGLGITLVPYSPLGRAALTGRLAVDTDFGADDFRTTLPTFSGDSYTSNLRLVGEHQAFSDHRGYTAGQVALAWLLAQPHAVAPIPGTKRV